LAHYDVVIIGGGIIGLSVSYYLLLKKKKVLILEKGELGSGASSSCDDAIFLQSKKPGILLDMTLESVQMYKSLSKELEIDLEFENRGGMILIEDDVQLKAMEEFVKTQNSYGLPVEMLDRKDVLKKQPFVRKDIKASTYCSKDSQVNPLKVMRGFLKKGTALGLELKTHIEITEIIQREGSWEIRLKDGSHIKTEYVVNAAGAWAPDIGKLIGAEIPIRPKRGQIIVTQQVPPLGETNAWSADYIAAKMNPQIIQNKPKRYRELGIGLALSQASSGNYLIGSTREYVGFDKSTTYEALTMIMHEAIRLFPILKNVHMIRSFAGFRPASEDGKAIVGEVDGKKGFYIAAGHEGDGIALAPITGKVMASMICGEKVIYPMEELSLNRFKSQKMNGG